MSSKEQLRRVNTIQKGLWLTHEPGTSASFPGTKKSYITQADTTLLSVQFEHQLVIRVDWDSGWNMPCAPHTCRDRAQHTSTALFCFLFGLTLPVFSRVTNHSTNTDHCKVRQCTAATACNDSNILYLHVFQWFRNPF